MSAPTSGRRRIDYVLSPLELWEHIAKTPKPQRGSRMSDQDAPERWNGNVTWEEAQDLARNGWPDGVKKVGPVLARVDDLIAHAMPEPVAVYDIVGDAPDVGAYLAGIPENMLTTEIQEGASRMVRIIVNTGASAAVTPKTIEARGIIACALVDALERVGYRVEVVVALEAATRTDEKLRVGVRTVIKRAEEPLSLDRIAFALIHPAFMRRIMVRCLELIEDVKDRDAFVNASYGYPAPVVGAPGDVVIAELYGTDWTPERMADEVKKYLEEVGVHMHADGSGVPA